MADIVWNGDAVLANILAATKRAMNNCVDDLVRTSSEATPHDKGFLDESWDREVKVENGEVVGAVGYGVREKDRSGNVTNYAVWIHEGTYNLGEGSLAKSGGDSGLSGKHYPVGNKFLERPFKGDSKSYEKHIADMVKEALK
jgi:hypothetical protein